MKSLALKHPMVYQVILILFTLIISAMLGTAMLVIVYLLPTERIKNHLCDTAQVYLSETDQYELAPGYRSATLDNTTDSIMLGEASYRTGNFCEDAMLVPHVEFENHDQLRSFLGYINGDVDNQHILTYARYWHGYLVFLKPFLSLFDFSDLRMFNLLFSISGAFVLLLSMWNNSVLKKYTFGMIAVLLFWNVGCMGLCLQYMACYNITIWSAVFIINKYSKLINSSNSVRFFCVIGICTAYFDFLTYPIATLGIPLSLYAILYFSHLAGEIRALKQNLLHFLRLSVCWGIGYLGMWFEKWIIGDFLTDENVVSDGLQNVISRTGTLATNTEPIPSRILIPFYIIRVSAIKWVYVLLLIVLICTILLWKKRNQYTFYMPQNSTTLVLFLILIGFLPLIWYFVAANHSYIHPRLVYRALGVSLFAWSSAIMSGMNRVGKNGNMTS